MKKKGVIEDYLIWILLAVALLVLVIVAIAFMGEGGVSLIEKVKALIGMK